MSKWGTEGATPKSLHRVAQGGCPAPSPLVASAALSLAPGVGALFFFPPLGQTFSHTGTIIPSEYKTQFRAMSYLADQKN